MDQKRQRAQLTSHHLFNENIQDLNLYFPHITMEFKKKKKKQKKTNKKMATSTVCKNIVK